MKQELLPPGVQQGQNAKRVLTNLFHINDIFVNYFETYMIWEMINWIGIRPNGLVYVDFHIVVV
jgi:hypothetical protein